MAINPQIMQELKERIAENTLQDDEDLLLFIQIASRLAALGEREAFERIPEIIRQEAFAGRFEEILAKRCAQGRFDISEQIGEELGFSLVEAQDFHAFYLMAQDKEWFPAGATIHFKAWEETAEECEIDEEALEILDGYLAAYPIANEMTLTAVQFPLTRSQKEFLIKAAPKTNIQTYNAVWDRPAEVKHAPQIFSLPKRPAYSRYTFAVACDSDTPSPELMKKHEFRKSIVVLPQGTFQIKKVLRQNWKFIVEIQKDGKPMMDLDIVRLGVLPGFPIPEKPGCWGWDLKNAVPEIRKNALEADLQMTQFGAFKITIH